MAFKSTKFIGGAGDVNSFGTEGLAMALNVFDKLKSKREKVQEVPSETSRFVIYIANSPPYELPVEHVPKYVGWKVEDVLKKYVEIQIKLSIFCPRKIPVLFRLFREAGGDISKYKEKNYARDPKHLVILNGFELPLVAATLPAVAPSIPANSPGLPVPTTTTPQSQQGKGAQQINTSLIQTLPGNNIPSSTVTQSVTPPTMLPTQSGKPVQVQQQPVQQNPSQQPRPRMPATPVNVNQGPRGPRPNQQPWPTQPGGSSPSDILRKQLTQQGINKAQQSQAQSIPQKQAPLVRPQAGKQAPMASQGNKQGSPQPQMKQQQVPKQMAGKPLQLQQHKSNEGSKIEADSSAGIPPMSIASVQMQTGIQVPNTSSIPANQRHENKELITLLQTPSSIIRTNAPNTVPAVSVNSTLRPQLTARAMVPTIANPRGATAQAPGGQTVMIRPQMPVGQNQPVNPAQSSAMEVQNQGIESRKVIWTGELQWKENSKVEPNLNKKMEHTVVCSVTSKKDDNGMPEVKPDNWPPKLIMQLIPKTLVQKLGGHFFNHSRSVLFHPQKSESLDILTRVLGTGYAGCVVSFSVANRAALHTDF